MAGNAPERETAAQPQRAEPDERLREMRHRFRNALQFLNSLVGLHARRTSDPQARGAFKDLRARLVTLSWIYDELDAEDGAAVRLAAFLPRLANHVAGLHDSGARHALVFDLADVRVSTQRAVTAGQILAELLVGIYACDAPGLQRTIEVRLADEGGRRCRLEVAEVGASGPRERAAADPLGMVVVESLAKNLDGRLEGAGGGTVVLAFDAGPQPAEAQPSSP